MQIYPTTKTRYRQLFSPQMIQLAVHNVAEQIAPGNNFPVVPDPLVVLIVLKGAFVFGADLIRELYTCDVHCQVDFIHCSSYHSRMSTGLVSIHSMPSINLRGRRVLIVEDIVDSGITLKEVREAVLKVAGGELQSLKTCALLDKKDARRVEVKLDYKCFDVPNVFVVGYGLDDEGTGRELPWIGSESP